MRQLLIGSLLLVVLLAAFLVSIDQWVKSKAPTVHACLPGVTFSKVSFSQKHLVTIHYKVPSDLGFYPEIQCHASPWGAIEWNHD